MKQNTRSVSDLKWQITAGVLSSKIDDEIVLMSIEAGYYFSLDPVGTRIWELLSEQPASIADLVLLLTDEYDVSEETCRKDVESFINTMVSKKLLSEAR